MTKEEMNTMINEAIELNDKIEKDLEELKKGLEELLKKYQ